MGKRTLITARYALAATDDPRRVRRTYAGEVQVEIALLGGRIERQIVEDMGKSMEIAAAGTQAWIDGHRV